MKILSVLFLFCFAGFFNAQVYLDVNYQPPVYNVSEGKISAEIMNYSGNVDYSIEIIEDFMNITIVPVDTNFVDTLKFGSLVSIYAVDNLDTVAAFMLTGINNSFITDSTYVKLSGVLNSMTDVSCDGLLSYDCNTNAGDLGSSNRAIFIQSTPSISSNSTIVVDSTVNNNGVFSNLCSGKYYLSVGPKDQSNFTSRLSLTIDEQLASVNNPTYTAQIQHSINSVDSCEAISVTSVTGTTGPYQFSYDGSSYTYDSVATDLCSGLHLLRVVDNGNDTLVQYFSVADSSQFLSQNGGGGIYVDSITLDFQNCNFDYNTPVDSANILSIDSIAIDTYSWTIEIWQNGIYNVYADTITMSAIAYGLNQCYVTVFCPVKASSSKTFKFEDDYTYNAYTSSINENLNELKVYPNPVRGVLTIVGSKTGTYVVTDIAGKIIMARDASQNKIDVINLMQGVYLITYMSEKGEIIGTTKFIKE